MIDFQLDVTRKRFDAAFCTVDTFRHLLSEKQAEQHLINMAKSLKKNAVYVLGLHLVPDHAVSNKVIRWTAKRGRLTVKTSMSMIANDRKKRSETLKVILRAETTKQKESHSSIYQLRTYTLRQLKKLIDSTAVFELTHAFDENYDIAHPITLNSKSEYAVLLLRKK